MRRLAKTMIIFALASALALPAAAKEFLLDGVPLPSDVAPLAKAQKSHPDMTGTWVGAWGGVLKHIMVIESVRSDGKAKIIYAYGDAPFWGITRSWIRMSGTLKGNRLTVKGSQFQATYDLLGNNTLNAIYARGRSRSQATMRRLAVTKPSATTKVKWNNAETIMLPTALTENGKAVRLKTILSKPAGKGPHPLAVINHGSTGNGKNAASFDWVWFDPGLAEFFTSRGYIAAFPQRRGRGGSDGLYDEGFARDRKQGYACNAKTSLKGADRAMDDLRAAIDSLRKRDDVDDAQIVVSGVSRGGILSAAFAGKYPKEIKAVVNFVGGWMGERCHNASKINESLFRKAADYGGETLWLYGTGDPFYSIQHSKKNFAAFEQAGGKGIMNVYDVPGGNGHLVHLIQPLWGDAANTYMNKVAP